MSRRLEAAAILGGMAATTSKATKERGLKESLAVLDAVVPVARQRMTVEQFRDSWGYGGFMASRPIPAGYLQSMKMAGAQHARCWYNATWDGQKYEIDESHRATMAAGIEVADSIGLSIVIALAIPQDAMPWRNARRTAAYVAFVGQVAAWHRDQPNVIGIDGMNEPVTVEPQANPGSWSPEQFQQVHDDWRDLATHCAHAVNAAAPGMLFMYQVGLGGASWNFDRAEPIRLPWVVHSAHVYHPHSFTHQNVSELVRGETPAAWLPYTEADRQALKSTQETMAQWSDRHGLPIYYGETSAIRHAPGAVEYVRDVVDFARNRRWPVSYHEWRGWDGWAPGADVQGLLKR